MEQGQPNIFPEPGILQWSLLSLKREKLPFDEHLYTSLSALYKHYLLIFKSLHQGEDCVVFDTKNGTAYKVKTGLDLYQRLGFSFCSWKDNIFVLFGGTLEKPGLGENERNYQDVDFLYVIEKDGEISFEVKCCKITAKKWWIENHSAQVYEDNMYIFGKKSWKIQEPLIVNRFDLNKRKWSSCQVIGNIQKFGSYPASVLVEKKIFVFGSYDERTGGGLVLLGGGNRPTFSNDMIALDLEKMEWEKPYDQSFYKERNLESGGIQVELMGDKIYISNSYLGEFLIYDPTKNEFSKTKNISPGDHWRIRSFKNHSILFRTSKDPVNKSASAYIQYQIFVTSPESGEQQDPDAHAEQFWKERPFPDVTFVVQNEEIPAHRVILLKSPYFQDIFNSGMIEAKSEKINVPDISPETFKAILEYTYCDKIELTESLAMELIILADQHQYVLPNLKAYCENYLSAKLTTENFVEVMNLAQTASSEKLGKKVVSFLAANIEKVRQEVDIDLIPAKVFVRAIMELQPTKK